MVNRQNLPITRVLGCLYNNGNHATNIMAGLVIGTYVAWVNGFAAFNEMVLWLMVKSKVRLLKQAGHCEL